ncbi:hypothetical protein [Aurantivibrio infirmus]
MKTFLVFTLRVAFAIKSVPNTFVEHGGYVQEVRYAESAGAFFGDAALAEKDNFWRYPIGNYTRKWLTRSRKFSQHTKLTPEPCLA